MKKKLPRKTNDRGVHASQKKAKGLKSLNPKYAVHREKKQQWDNIAHLSIL